jgi:hypothetical protein
MMNNETYKAIPCLLTLLQIYPSLPKKIVCHLWKKQLVVSQHNILVIFCPLLVNFRKGCFHPIYFQHGSQVPTMWTRSIFNSWSYNYCNNSPYWLCLNPTWQYTTRHICMAAFVKKGGICTSRVLVTYVSWCCFFLSLSQNCPMQNNQHTVCAIL